MPRKSSGKATGGSLPKPRGAPAWLYDPAIGAIICDRCAHGESLLSITRDKEMPSFPTLYKWMEAEPSFAENVARAKDVYAEHEFEIMQEIADDGRNDWMERLGYKGSEPSWEVNGEAIARSRLRIDTIKWRLSKLRPKKYGEKIEVDQTIGVTDALGALMGRVAENGKRLVPGLEAPKPDDDNTTE